MKLVFYAILFCYFFNQFQAASLKRNDSISSDPDYGISIDSLITSRGFKFEKHYITTDDGYILGVYRIINPYVKSNDRAKLKPIILQHGFLGSGADFLVNAPGGDAISCSPSSSNLEPSNSSETNNLGFLLANLCHDVWLSNSRGNTYSRNHTTLSPDKDNKFWEFTFDEMIKYDSPAIIDHVLKKTGYSSLAWIGHSQGTLIMFGLLAERPEFSLKIKPFIALAPVAFVDYISLPLRVASSIPGTLWALRQVGGELGNQSPIMKTTEQIACGRWEPKVCQNLIYPLMGYNLKDLNESRLEVYRSQGYAGSSVWDLVHFGQNINARNFLKFDYGIAENYKRYGGPRPPKYALDQINSTQIALFYSKSDDLGDFKDVTRLMNTIKVPLLKDYFVPLPSWNHMDFLYSQKLYRYVHTVILETLKRSYSTEKQTIKNNKLK